MLLLATIAHPQMLSEREKAGELGQHLGRLVQPRHYPRIEETAAVGIPWAADNDAFGGWDEDKERDFVAMLERLAGVPGCLFVTAPDVVADSATTMERFAVWAPRIAAHGLPVGLVAQDGLLAREVPWAQLDALFIGGSNEFKLGPAAERLVIEATARGKWVHMGRVNGGRRAAYAATIGCDSFDGSSFAVFRTTWLQTGLAWAAAPARERLWASS